MSFIEDDPTGPHAFIQWKGTDVCMDFHCDCGKHFHIDAEFAYNVQCPYCEQVWEMPCNLFPRKTDKTDGCIVRGEKSILGEDYD